MKPPFFEDAGTELKPKKLTEEIIFWISFILFVSLITTIFFSGIWTLSKLFL